MRLLIVASFMGTSFGDKIKGALLVVEAHAALTQALAATLHQWLHLSKRAAGLKNGKTGRASTGALTFPLS
jgi:hypothetical protein